MVQGESDEGFLTTIQAPKALTRPCRTTPGGDRRERGYGRVVVTPVVTHRKAWVLPTIVEAVVQAQIKTNSRSMAAGLSVEMPGELPKSALILAA